MRILFFSPYFFPYLSGLTIYPLRILTRLGTKYTVKVLTFSHKRGLKKEERLNRLQIVRMPFLFRISKGFISPQSISIFSRELQRADVVIINLPSVEGLWLAFLARVHGKTVISIYHCNVVITNNLLGLLASAVLRFTVWIQLALSTKIIATPDYVQSQRFFSRMKKKIVPILPPIVERSVKASTLSTLLKEKGEKKWVGFVGRVAAEKGIEYLVGAISHLATDRNVELIFAGPSGSQVVGEKRYFQQIKILLREKNIPYRFFGRVEDEEIGPLYKALDVLVLPSINQTESFGMVQAEAMLSGTPVVASDLPGVRLPIKLTQMGILVSPKNSSKLAEAIRLVLEDRRKFSNPVSIQKAQEVFAVENVYSFYEHLFSGIHNITIRK